MTRTSAIEICRASQAVVAVGADGVAVVVDWDGAAMAVVDSKRTSKAQEHSRMSKWLTMQTQVQITVVPLLFPTRLIL
jgi:3-deoxy-D-arabino-heptulosonate 7-phosphate (DAHP) synthase